MSYDPRIEEKIRGILVDLDLSMRELVELTQMIGAPGPVIPPPVEPPPVIPPPTGSWWNPPAQKYWRPVGQGIDRSANRDNLLTVLRAARAGDVVTCAPGVYPRLDWTTVNGCVGGAPSDPITLQAKPGERVEFAGLGVNDNAHALRIEGIQNYRLSGVGVGNSQFPMRAWASNGQITHVTVHDAGHAAFGIQHDTHHVLVEACTVARSGRALIGVQPYGEGIYLGSGDMVWVDKTNNVEIRWCDISGTIGDGMDIKPGCFEIHAHHNRLHDLDVRDGAVISHANNMAGQLDPHPEVLKRIRIDHNLIWNIGWGGQANSAYGIWVEQGGEIVADNLLWGFNPAFGASGNVRGINIRGQFRSTAHSIELKRNTIWVAQSIVRYYNAGVTPPPLIVEDNITPDGLLGSTKWTTGQFTGPVPGVNVKGEAMGVPGPRRWRLDDGTAFRPKMRVDA